jgi:hypothetical protein
MSLGSYGWFMNLVPVAVDRAKRSTTENIMKKFVLVPLVAQLLSSTGCITSTVIRDAKDSTENAPWTNYLLLPLTIPADIATSPFQIAGFISYGRGDRAPRAVVVRRTDDQPNQGKSEANVK